MLKSCNASRKSLQPSYVGGLLFWFTSFLCFIIGAVTGRAFNEKPLNTAIQIHNINYVPSIGAVFGGRRLFKTFLNHKLTAIQFYRQFTKFAIDTQRFVNLSRFKTYLVPQLTANFYGQTRATARVFCLYLYYLLSFLTCWQLSRFNFCYHFKHRPAKALTPFVICSN